jgi:predicted ATPase
LRIVREFLNEEFNISATTFIPAGRSVFSILANQVQLFEGDRVDETIKNFANQINEIRERKYPTRGLVQSSDNVIQQAIDLYRKILKGSYLYDRNQDKIQLNDGIDITLEKASSGQQESLWPILILFNLIRDKDKNFLIFEEPEAHLYPEAQKLISELISLCVNQPNNQIVVTTHSPYILSALNTLLYSNEVGKKHPEKVEKVVDRNLWLDYDRVMTYFVDNGTVRSIMDEEMKMIKSEEIDSASRIINEQYSDLADIEFSK